MGLAFIAAGGALGALARYGLTGWIQSVTGGAFPWGTMVVNVLGSLLIGFAVAWLESAAVTAEAREFVAIGLLGAFTTFSTFTYEAVALLRDGDWIGAGGYVAGSLALGLVGVLLGLAAAAMLLQAEG